MHYLPPGAYCSCVGCVTCVRLSAFAPRPLFESNFLFPLSSFSFSRPSSHFCLHDLSRIPTNFWRGSLLPLTTYFCVAIFLSSRCVLFCAFYHCLFAQLRTKHCYFLRSLNLQLRHWRHQIDPLFPQCESLVLPCCLSLLLLHSSFEPVAIRCTCFVVTSISP